MPIRMKKTKKRKKDKIPTLEPETKGLGAIAATLVATGINPALGIGTAAALGVLLGRSVRKKRKKKKVGRS